MKVTNGMQILLWQQDHLKETILEVLRRKDPDFASEEADFAAGRGALERLPEIRDAAKNYLMEEELHLSRGLLRLFWQGVYQNLECFRSPAQQLVLKMDWEAMHREYLLEPLPADSGKNIAAALGPERQGMMDPVISYYCYLETAAYKLAHFYGFCFGDTLLPEVVPGYRPNRGLTSDYEIRLRSCLGFSPV